MTRRSDGGLRSGSDGFRIAIAIVTDGLREVAKWQVGRKPSRFPDLSVTLPLSGGFTPLSAANGRTPHDSKSRPAAWNNRAAPASQRERDLTWVSATNRAMPQDLRPDPPYGALEVEQVERPSQGQRHGWNCCL